MTDQICIRFVMGFRHQFGAFFRWIHHNFLILFQRRFPEGFFGSFDQIWDRKWSRASIPNSSKIFKKIKLLPLGVIFRILACFGINLVAFWCAFGDFWCALGALGPPFSAISWHLRLALAWFGIILRPFLSNFVLPESGHEFTWGFRQSLVIFHRASWYLIKLLGNLVFHIKALGYSIKGFLILHKSFLVPDSLLAFHRPPLLAFQKSLAFHSDKSP